MFVCVFYAPDEVYELDEAHSGTRSAELDGEDARFEDSGGQKMSVATSDCLVRIPSIPPGKPNNQKQMDVSPNSHFLCKGFQLPYWNNRLFLVVWVSRFI